MKESNLLSELKDTSVSLIQNDKSEKEHPNDENLELALNELNEIWASWTVSQRFNPTKVGS